MLMLYVFLMVPNAFNILCSILVCDTVILWILAGGAVPDGDQLCAGQGGGGAADRGRQAAAGGGQGAGHAARHRGQDTA
jgi:hypothetical protein